MNPLPIRAQIAQILLQHFPNNDLKTIDTVVDQLCDLMQLPDSEIINPETFIDFLNTLIINNPKLGTVKLNPRDTQIKLAQGLQSNEQRIIHRAQRQVGTSTVLLAYAAWNALFEPWQCVLYMTNTYQQMKDTTQKLQAMIMPNYFKHLATNNTSLLRFHNGSQIIFANTKNITSVKGLGVNLIVMDNADHIPYATSEQILQGILPTLCTPRNGKIIISGGPSSFVGVLDELWKDVNWCKIDQI